MPTIEQIEHATKTVKEIVERTGAYVFDLAIQDNDRVTLTFLLPNANKQEKEPEKISAISS